MPNDQHSVVLGPLTLLSFELLDVKELLGVPRLIPGSRYKIMQISKAAVVMITACAETFFEQLAKYSCAAVVDSVKPPNILKIVLGRCQHGKIENFHNPTSRNVDSLIRATIGLPSLSGHWPHVKIEGVPIKKKYDQFVDLRHKIAHKNCSNRDLTIGKARQYVRVLDLIAKSSVATVQKHIRPITGDIHW